MLDQDSYKTVPWSATAGILGSWVLDCWVCGFPIYIYIYILLVFLVLLCMCFLVFDFFMGLVVTVDCG